MGRLRLHLNIERDAETKPGRILGGSDLFVLPLGAQSRGTGAPRRVRPMPGAPVSWAGGAGSLRGKPRRGGVLRSSARSRRTSGRGGLLGGRKVRGPSWDHRGRSIRRPRRNRGCNTRAPPRAGVPKVPSSHPRFFCLATGRTGRGGCYLRRTPLSPVGTDAAERAAASGGC